MIVIIPDQPVFNRQYRTVGYFITSKTIITRISEGYNLFPADWSIVSCNSYPIINKPVIQENDLLQIETGMNR
jgi:hypothetical protein